jgi:rare lipoprotein A (RlpA)-like double-psi beta-barrel protein
LTDRVACPDIVRTRLIVAIAALMAASALVAIPEPAGSRAPSSARQIDPATLRAVSISLPAGSPATTIPTLDTAARSAGWLGPGSTFLEPGQRRVPSSRASLDQPDAPAGTFVKNYWRFDPNISWYGRGFYGSGTACGQVYTRTILGVAHRTLPCGTLITFRNPANGRQITVPVIDRGPYVAGRQWDMSRGLCDYLDHCYTGSIEWRWGR